MEILLNDELNRKKLEGVCLTLGNFDGIHLGHQEVLKRVVERARALNTRAMVFTFEPHPAKVVAPHKSLPLITTLTERQELIGLFGVDILYIAHFTDEFAMKHPEEFIRDILIERIGPEEIIVGYDYAFGRGKKGGIPLLKEMEKEGGFHVEVIPPYKIGGRLVSSSVIRDFILKGDVKEAARFLGRCYSLKGRVTKGEGRGRQLGFPTANIEPEKELIPKRGIYATSVVCEGEIYKGVANIGYNPTFNTTSSRLSIEVYLIDFNKDVYGRKIELLFVDRIRDEIAFDSPLRLTEQIKSDIQQAEEMLDKIKIHNSSKLWI